MPQSIREGSTISRLCVLGAGSWGTALSIALSTRFDAVCLWSHNPERASSLRETRENLRYLPGFVLPGNILVSGDAATCLREADIVLIAIPSAFLRGTLRRLVTDVPPTAKLISATKGIEEVTLLRMSEVIHDVFSHADERPIAVLSGPTFAREIAGGEPAAVVVASTDLSFAEQMQSALSTRALRFYATTDVIGVELGAALKNVIALGAGICKGLGLGSNSVAALVTRGLAEITRLAVRLGGNPHTLSGLAGLGDLVLTATGDLSRNRSVGIELGRGTALDTVLSRMSMVAEGVGTCAAAYQLGIRSEVDLPIINKMHEILFEAKDPRVALRELMERPLKIEVAAL